MIYENENEADGILKILIDLQQYQAYVGDEKIRVYEDLPIMADQLSVERGINCQFQQMNGFTPEERFEEMHFEIADFHTEMKFLQVQSVQNGFKKKLKFILP